MNDVITVRVGRPADLEPVMELARLMHDEIGITAYAPAKMVPEIWGALNLDGGIMGLIGAPGGPVEGGILLRKGEFGYSNEAVLEEKGLFIHPDFRSAKGGRARLLCEFAKQAADQLGMPLFIGVQNDVRTKGKLRLYERQFGDPIGAFFLWRPGQAPTVAQEEAA